MNPGMRIGPPTKRKIPAVSDVAWVGKNMMGVHFFETEQYREPKWTFTVESKALNLSLDSPGVYDSLDEAAVAAGTMLNHGTEFIIRHVAPRFKKLFKSIIESERAWAIVGYNGFGSDFVDLGLRFSEPEIDKVLAIIDKYKKSDEESRKS